MGPHQTVVLHLPEAVVRGIQGMVGDDTDAPTAPISLELFNISSTL